ncbi:MAG: hypothetical protein ACM3L6_03535 [Deltaproteobacteria bacterium]
MRVRSIGCLWFFVVLLLAAVGLCGTGVYILHQEFVRVYSGLEENVGRTADRLTIIERELNAAEKERGSLSADLKELKVKQGQLVKAGEALIQEWQKTKEATVAYQGSLQGILEEVRRKKEISAALEQRAAAAAEGTEDAPSGKND